MHYLRSKEVDVFWSPFHTFLQPDSIGRVLSLKQYHPNKLIISLWYIRQIKPQIATNKKYLTSASPRSTTFHDKRPICSNRSSRLAAPRSMDRAIYYHHHANLQTLFEHILAALYSTNENWPAKRVKRPKREWVEENRMTRAKLLRKDSTCKAKRRDA